MFCGDLLRDLLASSLIEIHDGYAGPLLSEYFCYILADITTRTRNDRHFVFQPHNPS